MYNGKEFDSIYPRSLSGSRGMNDELIKQEDIVIKIMKSKSFVFDSWSTILVEDKDLRFIAEQNKDLQKYLPEILDTADFYKSERNISDYVLKIRDLDSGRGVLMSPDSVVEDKNSILEEKINANKYPVATNYGNIGEAIYDTGVHVAYNFNRRTKDFDSFNVGGILSRFSLQGEIVNMCRGGGMIPTFIEK